MSGAHDAVHGRAGRVWVEVGDGCFQRRYQALALSVGAVRSGDGLLVVDTRSHDGEAEELLRDLRLLGGPVRAVVNTHWHFDHTFGNARFRAAAGLPAAAGLVEVAAPLPIHGHRQVPELLGGLGPAVREELVAGFADDPDQAKAFEQVELVSPDRLVDTEQVVELGDRVVLLRHLGRGHTGNDLVVQVPDAGVVFAGDLVEEAGPPAFGDDSYPLDWPGTLQALLDLLGPDDTVVPGHGRAVTRGFVADQRAAIQHLTRRLTGLFRAGVPAGGALATGADWPFPAEALGAAVARAWAQLDGSLG